MNNRLAMKQDLTKQHLKECEDFKACPDPDTISLHSLTSFSERGSTERASIRSNRSSKSISVGTSSL